MSSSYENSSSWTDNLADTINKFLYYLLNLLTTTFGLEFSPTDIANVGDDFSKKLSEFFHEFIALLSFDEFQLQLLKVFLLTFVSTVALIFVAWQIYGPRISDQFMEQSTTSGDCDSSSGE